MEFEKIRLDGRELLLKNTQSKSSPGFDAPYTSYCLGRRDVLVELAAFKELCLFAARLLGGSEVLELFGGAGWHSYVIRSMLSPKKHRVCDISQDCVDTIKANYGVDVEALKLDSFEMVRNLRANTWDWIHADFNQFTLNRHFKDKQYAGVLSGLFSGARRFITLTDSAYYGLSRFVRNRQAYCRLLDYEDAGDWRAYYAAAGRYYRREYGWCIRDVITWSGAASMYLMEPGEQREIRFHNQPKAPLELVLL